MVNTFSVPLSLVNPNGFTATLNKGTKADGTTTGTAQLTTVQPVKL